MKSQPRRILMLAGALVCMMGVMLGTIIAFVRQDLHTEISVLKQKLSAAEQEQAVMVSNTTASGADMEEHLELKQKLSAAEQEQSVMASNTTASSADKDENMEPHQEKFLSNPEATNDYDQYLAIKHIFNGLPTTSSSQIKPMILKNFIRRDGKKGLKKMDITLATQLSTSKFKNLLTQLDYWNGPASVAVYISKLEDLDMLYNFTRENRKYVHETSFHLVLEKPGSLLYPINILRNVAMEAIESDYFLAIDVDLVPFPRDCHDRLVSAYFNIKLVDKESLLFILPAFALFPQEGEEYATADMLPSSKEMTLAMVKNGKMDQFWKDKFPSGHGPTDYEQWFANTGKKKDSFYPIHLSYRSSLSFEPYVVGFKPGIPRYWEGKSVIVAFLSFVWFHTHLLTWYRYAVLNDFYAVHLDHPSIDSRSKMQQLKASSAIFERMQSSFLRKRYGKRGMPTAKEQFAFYAKSGREG
eukprot:scaffold1_cov108-Cylindrotheca_fusiformis.AAC.1